MKLVGEQKINATREVVFAALNDTGRLAHRSGNSTVGKGIGLPRCGRGRCRRP